MVWYNWIVYPLAVLGALVVYSTIKNIWRRRIELSTKLLMKMNGVKDIQIPNI